MGVSFDYYYQKSLWKGKKREIINQIISTFLDLLGVDLLYVALMSPHINISIFNIKLFKFFDREKISNS